MRIYFPAPFYLLDFNQPPHTKRHLEHPAGEYELFVGSHPEEMFRTYGTGDDAVPNPVLFLSNHPSIGACQLWWEAEVIYGRAQWTIPPRARPSTKTIEMRVKET